MTKKTNPVMAFSPGPSQALVERVLLTEDVEYEADKAMVAREGQQYLVGKHYVLEIIDDALSLEVI